MPFFLHNIVLPAVMLLLQFMRSMRPESDCQVVAARFSGGDPVPELEDISKASDERASWNSCKVNDASVRLPMSLSTAAALGEWPEKVMYYCSTHALKYTRSSQVASGGFSDVFLGLVHSTGSLVCLKQPALGYSESDIKAMEAEVETLRSLDHPNVVKYLGTDRKEGFCIILEYLPGGSIA
jgi:serine/threonine protein kinase